MPPRASASLRAAKRGSASGTRRAARCPSAPARPTASCAARPRPRRLRARARRRRRPSGRPASSSAARRRRAGARAIARDRAEARRCRGCRAASTSGAIDCHGTPARNARIAATASRRRRTRGSPTGAPEVRRSSGAGRRRAATSRPGAGSPRSSSSPCQPAPSRSARKSWPCSATSSASARPARRASRARRSCVEVDRRGSGRSCWRRRCASRRVRPAAAATGAIDGRRGCGAAARGGASSSFGSDLHAEPRLVAVRDELVEVEEVALRRVDVLRRRGTTRGRSPVWFERQVADRPASRARAPPRRATRAPRRRRAAGRRGRSSSRRSGGCSRPGRPASGRARSRRARSMWSRCSLDPGQVAAEPARAACSGRVRRDARPTRGGRPSPAAARPRRPGGGEPVGEDLVDDRRRGASPGRPRRA